MPELFTLTELQTIYEIILGHTLEKNHLDDVCRKREQLRKQGNKKLSVNALLNYFVMH
jgi:hypothetical protein